MTNKAAQNEEKVLAALVNARSERERRDAEHGWERSYPTTRPFSLTVRNLAHATSLTEGKVRGALKRLETAGTAECVRTPFGGRRSSEYASAAEVAAARVANEDEERAEILERHGSVNGYKAQIELEIGRVREALDTLQATLKCAHDVPTLKRIDHAVPSVTEYYTRKLLEELAE